APFQPKVNASLLNFSASMIFDLPEEFAPMRTVIGPRSSIVTSRRLRQFLKCNLVSIFPFLSAYSLYYTRKPSQAKVDNFTKNSNSWAWGKGILRGNS